MFHGTKPGTGSDNPSEPIDLTTMPYYARSAFNIGEMRCGTDKVTRCTITNGGHGYGDGDDTVSETCTGTPNERGHDANGCKSPRIVAQKNAVVFDFGPLVGQSSTYDGTDASVTKRTDAAKDVSTVGFADLGEGEILVRLMTNMAFNTGRNFVFGGRAFDIGTCPHPSPPPSAPPPSPPPSPPPPPPPAPLPPPPGPPPSPPPSPPPPRPPEPARPPPAPRVEFAVNSAGDDYDTLCQYTTGAPPYQRTRHYGPDVLAFDLTTSTGVTLDAGGGDGGMTITGLAYSEAYLAANSGLGLTTAMLVADVIACTGSCSRPTTASCTRRAPTGLTSRSTPARRSR